MPHHLFSSARSKPVRTAAPQAPAAAQKIAAPRPSMALALLGSGDPLQSVRAHERRQKPRRRLRGSPDSLKPFSPLISAECGHM